MDIYTEFRWTRDTLRALGRSSWFGISAATGVPFSTIKRIAYGMHDNPTLDSWAPLHSILRGKNKAIRARG